MAAHFVRLVYRDCKRVNTLWTGRVFILKGHTPLHNTPLYKLYKFFQVLLPRSFVHRRKNER